LLEPGLPARRDAGAGPFASGGDMVTAHASLTDRLESVARPQPTDAESRRAWTIAATVTDPEIPVLTIEDLGVLRSVEVDDDSVAVTLTPTYSGCPAMDAMSTDVRLALERAGYRNVSVDLVLSPAWT